MSETATLTTPLDGPIALMERRCGGWSTELQLCPDGRIAIVCQQGEDAPVQSVFVTLEKALDAYHHPYCYLPVQS